MGVSTVYVLFLIQEGSSGPKCQYRSQLSPKIRFLLSCIVAKLSNVH
jgi:hypothetical protein